MQKNTHQKLSLVEASVPEFIYPIDNITVAAGRDAQFTCVVNNLEGHKVCYYPKKKFAFSSILFIKGSMAEVGQQSYFGHPQPHGHQQSKVKKIFQF